MSLEPRASHQPRRRALLVVGVLVAVALTGVLALWFVDRGSTEGVGGQPTKGATGTVSPRTPAPSPTPQASVDPSQTLAPGPSGSSGPPATSTPSASQLPPVEPDDTATSAGGLAVDLVDAEAVTGTPVQPGDVGGPAVRMTISLTNPGAEEVSLSGLVVNCYYGADETPASGLTAPGGVAMPSAVAAGSTVTGVYLFTVPREERSSVRLTLDLAAGEPLVVFEGDVS